MHHTLKTAKYFCRLNLLFINTYNIDAAIFILETRRLEGHRTGKLKKCVVLKIKTQTASKVWNEENIASNLGFAVLEVAVWSGSSPQLSEPFFSFLTNWE